FRFWAWVPYAPAFLPTNSFIVIVSIAWLSLSLIIAFIVQRKVHFIEPQKPSPIDVIYDRVLISPLFRLGDATAWVDDRVIDRMLHRLVYLQVTIAKAAGLVDRLIVDGAVAAVTGLIRGVGNSVRAAGTGRIQSYLVWAMAGFLALIIWILR